MRLPRSRFTVRWIMVAVTVLAISLWIAERRFRFQCFAEYHFLRRSV
jgi:hypothetical protein